MALSCIASRRPHIAAYRSVRFPRVATPTIRPLQRRTADERSTSVNIADLPRTAEPGDVASRVDALDWHLIDTDLDGYGCAHVPRLLSLDECRALAALYPDDTRYRSRVVMARHGFGRGEYKYFAYPLPTLVDALRTALYRRLAPIANRWNRALGIDTRYPADLPAFLARCHEAGQTRPTPLLLQYGPGDYNCLHQDLYGEHVFPLQVAILLSAPERDFTGGEFVLTEQRPRMQSRAEVVPLAQGDAVVFAVHGRPVQGTRGVYRVNLRHGVSRIRSGHRHTVGIIFHDAQ
nr:2OG-Fe(II) oxygenase [Burkholderia multivorans]